MKIIHCADMHLDSRMSAHLSSEKARERKREILDTFSRMVSYAANNEVKAILIAGDLFDTKNVTALARNTLINLITKNPSINFYYLKGNHDEDALTGFFEDKPDNLYLFTDEWTTYDLSESGLVKLHGVELTKGNSSLVQGSFAPDPMNINIVLLHGQESESAPGDKSEIINLRMFKNKGIDYMALGHVHAYKREELDSRCTYCYSGCLEGRGFDETGEHGFVLLDVDETALRVTDTFIPFAKRKIYEVNVDVTGLPSTPEMMEKVKEELGNSEATSEDIVRVRLHGGLDVECEKDVNFILHSFEHDYYFTAIKDRTSFLVNVESFRYDSSLKGEFVRNVLDDETLNEDEKGEIIRVGIDALMKGEIRL